MKYDGGSGKEVRSALSKSSRVRRVLGVAPSGDRSYIMRDEPYQQVAKEGDRGRPGHMSHLTTTTTMTRALVHTKRWILQSR